MITPRSDAVRGQTAFGLLHGAGCSLAQRYLSARKAEPLAYRTAGPTGALFGNLHADFNGNLFAIDRDKFGISNRAKYAARKVFRHCGGAVLKAQRIGAVPVRFSRQILRFVASNQAFHALNCIFRGFAIASGHSLITVMGVTITPAR